MSELPEGVVLDADINPEDVERHGAEPRAEGEVDVEAIAAAAEADAHLEEVTD